MFISKKRYDDLQKQFNKIEIELHDMRRDNLPIAKWDIIDHMGSHHTIEAQEFSPFDNEFYLHRVMIARFKGISSMVLVKPKYETEARVRQ